MLELNRYLWQYIYISRFLVWYYESLILNYVEVKHYDLLGNFDLWKVERSGLVVSITYTLSVAQYWLAI